MNIGITCYPTYGGSGTVATELGKKLAARGHHVHFIATSLPYRLSAFTENISFHEVTVLQYPLFDYVPYSLSLSSKMAQVALRERLDLMHVHYAVPHAASAYLARNILADRMRLPFITTLHGTDITLVGADPSYFDITRFSIRESDAVTSVSEYLKNQTHERFDLDTDIEVIPNFVDTGQFRPHKEEGRHCIMHNDDKIIMHISNFRPVKRVPDIVDVFAGVVEHVPSRLCLIGSGPEKEKVRQRVAQKGLRDRVHFIGPQDDVSPLLSNADLYLLLSEHESFGLTMLEAMSCGVPVIGTGGSGMNEVVGDSGAGKLFEVGDIPAMTEACIGILSDDAVAAKMGENGRRRAIGHFSEERVISRYEAMYERVLKNT